MKRTRYLIVIFIVFFLSGCQRNSVDHQGVNPSKTPSQVPSKMPLNSQEQIEGTSAIPQVPEIKTDDILGEFTTSFDTSSKERKQNIAVAADKINGYILYPKDEFSACEVLAPFTKENGYKTARGFADGQIVDSIGGGACQVTSTLYNAVLGAELTVLERHAHSMTVSYVDLGHDAAIAENLKDFRFLNSMDTPIVIEANTKDDRSLTIRIRGIDSRNHEKRSFYFETKILEEINPGESVISYDDHQSKDYVKITQSAKKGYTVKVYKIINNDGTFLEPILINESIYQPSPQRMIVGTGKKLN